VDDKSFLRSLKQRLRDCCHQEWNAKLSSSDRFAFYRSFKRTLCCESYLNYVNIKKFRDSFIHFRLGVNALRSNVRTEEEADRNCPFCSDIENEVHLLFQCNAYNDLRKKYLAKHMQTESDTNVAHMICGREVMKTRDAAMYIHYAFKLRCKKLDEIMGNE